jgi:exodeoxyribonuclease V alpha subunit
MPDLDALVMHGALGHFEARFAESLARATGVRDPLVLLAAALACRAVQRGLVCVDLPRMVSSPLHGEDGEPTPVAWPSLDAWIAALENSPICALHTGDPESEIAPRPLVLDRRGRLYLYRYAEYERRLAAAITQRLARRHPYDVDARLTSLFGGDRDNRQRLAARAALEHDFCVISGGPGTGKTSTVVRILALFQEQALAQRGEPMRIRLLAPTGKAAQRMRESVASQLDALDCEPRARAELARHADEASTIHRALGFRPRTPTRFRYGSDRPLPYDLVVVDEASMVDVALLCKLFDALPTHGRVVLLGDKDQLASVEAGAILGEIYGADLGDAAVHLTKSWRYREGSGIGKLTCAVNEGDADRAMAALGDDVVLAPVALQEELTPSFATLVTERFREWFSASDPIERLRLLGRFRVLCAHRRGRFGAVAVNAAIERQLRRVFGVRTDSRHYDGKPIIVTSNDHQLGLFNGDVGVISVAAGQPQAYFPADDDGSPRLFSAARIPAHEAVYAMTVHKSQGSEVDEIALVLPERVSPILTRELVYTAISRARSRATIYGSEAVLRQAIARRVERASGLADLLLGKIAPPTGASTGRD